MIAASYANATASLKSSPEAPLPFVIEAHGYDYPHPDYVTASIRCHRMSGKLFRVIADQDAPEGFRREEITPMPLNVAKRQLAPQATIQERWTAWQKANPAEAARIQDAYVACVIAKGSLHAQKRQVATVAAKLAITTDEVWHAISELNVG